MLPEIEESTHIIQKHFKNIDRYFASTSVSFEEKKRASEWLEKEQLIPSCSHSFTKHLGRALYSSFRILRMIDQPLMLALFGGTNKINLKDGGKLFATLFDIATPQTFSSRAKWASIRKNYECNIVIKQTAGTQANWVYGLIRDKSEIIDLFSGLRYKCMEDFKTENFNSEIKDQWEIEEFILDESQTGSPLVPIDIKFYTFYGKIPLILQVDRWSVDGKRYCWFQPDGEIVNTGKYNNTLLGRVAIPQFTKSDIDSCANLSKALPSPFTRIDFLKGDSGLVFGELTFNSGSPGSFCSHWDIVCGRAYQQARQRLLRDLIKEKPFTHFKTANSR